MMSRVVLIFAALAVLGGVAHADTPDEHDAKPDEAREDSTRRKRAGKFVDAGNESFEARDFEAALARFEDAYRTFPSPKILLNIAECHREMRRIVEALSHYRRFLETSGLDGGSELASRVRARIRELEERVARIGVDGALDGVRVTIDGVGEHLAPFDPIIVSPGVHQVDVEKDGYQAVHLSMSVLPGEVALIRSEFEPRVPSASAVGSDAPGTSSVTDAWWFWGAIATGVVGAIAVGLAVSSNGSSFTPDVELGRSATDDAMWRRR